MVGGLFEDDAGLVAQRGLDFLLITSGERRIMQRPCGAGIFSVSFNQVSLRRSRARPELRRIQRIPLRARNRWGSLPAALPTVAHSRADTTHTTRFGCLRIRVKDGLVDFGCISQQAVAPMP